MELSLLCPFFLTYYFADVSLELHRASTLLRKPAIHPHITHSLPPSLVIPLTTITLLPHLCDALRFSSVCLNVPLFGVCSTRNNDDDGVEEEKEEEEKAKAAMFSPRHFCLLSSKWASILSPRCTDILNRPLTDFSRVLYSSVHQEMVNK